MIKMKNIVLFIAHFINQNTIKRYQRLCKDLNKKEYDVVWIITLGDKVDLNLPSDIVSIHYHTSDLYLLN